MSAFQPQAGNWSLVNNVQMDPNRSIREKPPVIAEEPSKKKRKKKKKQMESQPAWVSPISYKAGKGILLNMNNDSLKDNLKTIWEHGDLELEIEVMVPKGSNSGIYFQGRYEVQIYDSYGKKNPYFGDMGGIYRKWGGNPDEVYMGKPPYVNAAKAPGLWQKYKIGFKAPRFDEQGNKISNATFVYVDLNGYRIHRNVEVPYSTRGAMSRKEVPLGPLLIQGDHGPMAFRNIRYRTLNQREISIQDLTYTIYEGKYKSVEDLADKTPVAQGNLDQLTCKLDGLKEPFVVVYQGNFQTQEKGNYPMKLSSVGNFQLDFGGKTVKEMSYKNPRRMNNSAHVNLNLQSGKNPFTLVYHKPDARNAPKLGIYTMDSYPEALHEFNSFIPNTASHTLLSLSMLHRPRIMRGFLKFKKDKPNKMLTHTMAVGNPQGVHFVYDLKTGTPACTWRGDFLNVTPMWHNRGGQDFVPMGAVQYLFSGLSVAYLPDSSAAFPKELDEKNGFHNKGYKLEKASHLPVFLYELDKLSVEDMLIPDNSGNALIRKMSFKGLDPAKAIYVKIAEGTSIEVMPNGSLLVDQQHYVKLHTSQEPIIRNMGKHKEAIILNTSPQLTYSIIW